jgi:hypothetical protein
MNYKNQMKIKLMREALKDFNNDFGMDPDEFFTNKDNFYFVLKDNIKYIHKKSLKMIYTNYDTFTNDIDPEVCKLKKDIEVFSICKLSLPEASPNFYKVPYLEGKIITSIDKNDFLHLKNKWDKKNFTPFYNQMVFNLIKNKKGIFIIDYKHFENRKDLPFFIYFYNKKFNINTLYYSEDLDKIFEYLKNDYPIKNVELVYYG